MYEKDRPAEKLVVHSDLGHLSISAARGKEWVIFSILMATFGGMVVAVHWNLTRRELTSFHMVFSALCLLVPGIYGAVRAFPNRVLMVDLAGTFVIVERRWLGIPISRLELAVDDLLGIEVGVTYVTGKPQASASSDSGCLLLFVIPFPFNLIASAASSRSGEPVPDVPVFTICIVRQSDAAPVQVLPTTSRAACVEAVAAIHVLRPALDPARG